MAVVISGKQPAATPCDQTSIKLDVPLPHTQRHRPDITTNVSAIPLIPLLLDLPRQQAIKKGGTVQLQARERTLPRCGVRTMTQTGADPGYQPAARAQRRDAYSALRHVDGNRNHLRRGATVQRGGEVKTMPSDAELAEIYRITLHTRGASKMRQVLASVLMTISPECATAAATHAVIVGLENNRHNRC